MIPNKIISTSDKEINETSLNNCFHFGMNLHVFKAQWALGIYPKAKIEKVSEDHKSSNLIYSSQIEVR